MTLISAQEQIRGVGCTAIIYAATAEQRTQETETVRELEKERRRNAALHRMTGDTPPEKDGPSGAKRFTEGYFQ